MHCRFVRPRALVVALTMSAALASVALTEVSVTGAPEVGGRQRSYYFDPLSQLLRKQADLAKYAVDNIRM